MQTDATPLHEAKQEYIYQLERMIDKKMYGKFFEIFVNVVERTQDPLQVLVEFQNEMENIRTWNTEIVSEHTKDIISDPEFFSQLLTAVLILKTKIMTAFKIDSSHKNVQLKVPSNEHFIHHLFTVAGHHLYNNPWVFVTDDSKTINTQRYKDCLDLIRQSIDESVTHFVPVRNILKEYIGVQELSGIDHAPPIDPPVASEPEPVPVPLAKEDPTDTKVFDESGRLVTPTTMAPPVAPVAPPMVSPLVPPPMAVPPTVHDTSDVTESDLDLEPKEQPPAFSEGIQRQPAIDLDQVPRHMSSENSNDQPSNDTFDSDSESESEYDYEPTEEQLPRVA